MYNMNLARLILLILTNVFIRIVNTSPNISQEMGADKDDKPANGGKVKSKFIKNILVDVVLTYCTINHAITMGDKPLGYFEILIFSLVTIGFILRLWCYRELGYYFTFGLGIRKDHKLIKTGPYKYLVHPSYTGQIMVLLFGLIFLRINPMLYLFITAIIINILLKRVKIEENMMLKEFGEEYKEYIKNRYRLIPYVY